MASTPIRVSQIKANSEKVSGAQVLETRDLEAAAGAGMLASGPTKLAASLNSVSTVPI
jgi:hypothetical protein